jgi:hypothetical protein
MSTFFFSPALDSELAHRRSSLLRDAATHRLARQARRAARTEPWTTTARPVDTRPAAAPAEAATARSRDQVAPAA